MEKNKKSEDDTDIDQTFSISILKLNKLHVSLCFNFKIEDKYIVVCEEYILLLRLIIYALYSFTHTFSAFYSGLLFIRRPTVTLLCKEALLY